MKILLIEDDKEYAETLADIFSENQDHDFLWVEKLENTEKAINTEKWDIILSDIHLNFHPERIVEFYKASPLNHETPLIFLTAERETKLAFDLIEKEDFPVVSKFEVDEDILSVVHNYTELYNLIKRQEDEVAQISFRKFLARYINEKRYENSELISSLSGWINQEKLIFSKLQANYNFYQKRAGGSQEPSLKFGYIKIDTKHFHIMVSSPGIEQFAGKDELKGMPLKTLIKNIVDSDKLYDFLHRLIKDGKDGRAQITLPKIGHKNNIYYDFFIYPQFEKNEEVKDLDIEVIQRNDKGIEKAELINLEETNKLLTKEVHHRVNNNLNVISSLVNLRMMNSDPVEAEVYQTVLEQITPITVVYEQLYLTKNIASVNLKDYLDTLNRKLFSNGIHSFTITKIDVEDEMLKLNLNQIIPLGLLLNEIFQMCKARKLKVDLLVNKQFDVINLVFQAEKISCIFDGEAILSGQESNLILNALLNKLEGLISFSGKDKIVIRFKKRRMRGGGSNLID